MERDLVAFLVIDGLMQTLNSNHIPLDWRLFIDSSKFSLKAVLLHNGNTLPTTWDCELEPPYQLRSVTYWQAALPISVWSYRWRHHTPCHWTVKAYFCVAQLYVIPEVVFVSYCLWFQSFTCRCLCSNWKHVAFYRVTIAALSSLNGGFSFLLRNSLKTENDMNFT